MPFKKLGKKTVGGLIVGATAIAFVIAVKATVEPSKANGTSSLLNSPASTSVSQPSDRTGDIVIKPQFDAAEQFSEGLAVVTIGGKKGYIDKTGNIVIKPQFDEAGNFEQGMASAKIGNQFGYIDKTGKMVVINPPFDQVSGFFDGLASVSIGDKFGYIDNTRNIVIKPQFKRAEPFREGLAQ